MTTAIYSLSLIGSDRLYIGSAVDLRTRLKQHFSLLQRGRHHAVKLQEEVRRFGMGNLMVSVLEAVSDHSGLIDREQAWIDRFDFSSLLNTSPTAENRLGAKMPESAKRRISESLIGNQYRKGVPHDQETKDKIAAGLRLAIAEGRRAIKYDPAVLRKNNARISAEGKARAEPWLTLYQAGATIDEIAAQTGYDESTVRRSLKRYFNISRSSQ